MHVTVWMCDVNAGDCGWIIIMLWLEVWGRVWVVSGCTHESSSQSHHISPYTCTVETTDYKYRITINYSSAHAQWYICFGSRWDFSGSWLKLVPRYNNFERRKIERSFILNLLLERKCSEPKLQSSQSSLTHFLISTITCQHSLSFWSTSFISMWWRAQPAFYVEQ